MANHASAAKRARQSIKRSARNNASRSRVRTAERKVLSLLTDPKKAAEALSEAFSVIQKSKSVLHRNAIKRRMSRLAKAVGVASKKSANG
jgi:small subunit ribosomal protein S20